MAAVFCSMLMIPALAADSDADTGVIEVSNADDLQRVGTGEEYPAGSGVIWSLSASYELTSDITLTGTDNFTPIGGSTGAFGGKFDGKGHTISGLSITSAFLPVSRPAGLFGTIQYGAEISNVIIDNATLISPNSSAGGIAGNSYESTITNCAVINSTIMSELMAGGIAGNFQIGNEGGVLMNCYSANSSVTTTSSSSANSFAGGIAGRITGDAFLVNCYSTNTVSATNGGKVGGIIGTSDGGFALNCYYLAGQLSVDGSAVADRIGGADPGDRYNVYYVPEINEDQERGAKTSSELKSESTYNAGFGIVYGWDVYHGWNFNDIWNISTDNDGYPILRMTGYVEPDPPVFYMVQIMINMHANEYEMQIVADGDKAVEPIASREGYDLFGWINAETFEVFDFDTPITSETMLLALWLVSGSGNGNGNGTDNGSDNTTSWSTIGLAILIDAIFFLFIAALVWKFGPFGVLLAFIINTVAFMGTLYFSGLLEGLL